MDWLNFVGATLAATSKTGFLQNFMLYNTSQPKLESPRQISNLLDLLINIFLRFSMNHGKQL